MGVFDAVNAVHDKAVFRRRIRVLSRHIAEMIPPDCESLLDIGCGDGAIDALLLQSRPALKISGIDVLQRPHTHIPVTLFDGSQIPLPDGSCDVAMMIDALHHTDDPNILLSEASRVARRGIIIKDHTRESWLAGKTLAFMDWVGNRGHGVALPYNYWSISQWQSAWQRLNLKPKEIRTKLGLYPVPARPIFERNLHILAYLEKM